MISSNQNTLYKCNLAHLGFERPWLYSAAISAASRLPLINLGTTSMPRLQLVLVRYSDDITLTNFIYKNVAKHQAMWTDMVSTKIEHTGKITGANRAELWKGLMVIRLGFDEKSEIPHQESSDGRNLPKISWRKAELGNEFWLRVDIEPEYVAVIPLTQASGIFVPHQGYALLPPLNLDNWLPSIKRACCY